MKIMKTVMAVLISCLITVPLSAWLKPPMWVLFPVSVGIGSLVTLLVIAAFKPNATANTWDNNG